MIREASSARRNRAYATPSASSAAFSGTAARRYCSAQSWKRAKVSSGMGCCHRTSGVRKIGLVVAVVSEGGKGDRRAVEVCAVEDGSCDDSVIREMRASRGVSRKETTPPRNRTIAATVATATVTTATLKKVLCFVIHERLRQGHCPFCPVNTLVKREVCHSGARRGER